MHEERLQKLRQIFDAAAAMDPLQRTAFLDKSCGSDSSLRCEVEALLESNPEARNALQAIVGGAAVSLARAMDANGAGSMAGKTVAHYEILELLGGGGMGVVYKARDLRLGRHVALKFLPDAFDANPVALERFQREARAASALNHPNICTIYDVGMHEGRPFTAMEYLDGETLRSRIRHGPIDSDQVLEIATGIADALEASHRAGIIHRDIKPANIFITRQGAVKVLDFGLAKQTQDPAGFPVTTDSLTHEGAVMGTVQYMSPEQVLGREVDCRTDLFSLGAVLYEMVAGRALYEGDSAPAIFDAILHRQAALPDTPLSQVMAKALEKDHDFRYQSASEMKADLKRLKRDTGSELYAATAVRKPPVSRRIAWRLAAACLAVLIAAAVIVSTFFIRSPVPTLTEEDWILLADFENKTDDPNLGAVIEQAVALSLSQSPFINLVPETRVQEALRYMQRPPGEPLTRDVARQICEREGNIKAILSGSIVTVSNRYIVAVNAGDCLTGSLLAAEQISIDSIDALLDAIGKAMSNLRNKLGESLASVNRFDVPVWQGTTGSLEAFRAFTAATGANLQGRQAEGAALLRRAIELDPAFAMAHARLATHYSNSGQPILAAEHARKAFELHDRVSAREGMYIRARFHRIVEGDLEKTIEWLRQWIDLYPRDWLPYNDLSVYYWTLGEFEKSAQNAERAAELDPRQPNSRLNLAKAYIAIDRTQEAKAVLQKMLDDNLDIAGVRQQFSAIAILAGNFPGIQPQPGRPQSRPLAEPLLLANLAAQQGKLKQARTIYQRAGDSARQRNLEEGVASIIATQAFVYAVFGNREDAATLLRGSPGLLEYKPPIQTVIGDTRQTGGSSLSVVLEQRPLMQMMMVAAALADAAPAVHALVRTVDQEYPADTLVQHVVLPAALAALEIARNNPSKAIELLQNPRYELAGAPFVNPYLRGLAYLKAEAPQQALEQFEVILNHRFRSPASPLWALAHLGQARALMMAGQAEAARDAYESLFELWKEADPDLELLQEARREHETLVR